MDGYVYRSTEQLRSEFVTDGRLAVLRCVALRLGALTATRRFVDGDDDGDGVAIRIL